MSASGGEQTPLSAQDSDGVSGNVPADSLPTEPAAPGDPGTGDVPDSGTPTLGGRQFWGDVRFHCGFKIQRNVFFGHYRLLDADDRRYASGSLAECEQMLQRLKAARGLTAESGHVVLLVHGIGRSSKSMSPIASGLPRDRFTPLSFEYPSTRVPLAQSAEYLQSVIEGLPDADRISFVVHSMGGLVVRRLLKSCHDPRLHRLVMLGTPNRGAELADLLRKNFLYRTLYGPAGQELVTGADSVISSLPVPEMEFGIVAGGCNNETGYNRMLPGDNDGTVTVASARLEGARDFLLVPRLHSFLMSDPLVIQAVRNFLDTGRFASSGA